MKQEKTPTEKTSSSGTHRFALGVEKGFKEVWLKKTFDEDVDSVVLRALERTAEEAYVNGHIEGRKSAWKDCEDMYEKEISKLKELNELLMGNCNKKQKKVWELQKEIEKLKKGSIEFKDVSSQKIRELAVKEIFEELKKHFGYNIHPKIIEAFQITAKAEREKTTKEIIDEIENIENEMIKSNDIWRLKEDVIISELLKKLKQKHGADKE